MTQRYADVDLNLELEELGLDWKQDDMWEGGYITILPAIPGYTKPGDPDNTANVYPAEPRNPYAGFDFHIYASTSDGEINLYSADFGLPLSENAGDAMATVGDIPIGSLIEAFEDDGIEPDEEEDTAHRTASMDLTWVENDGDPVLYEALLPPIPGYTQDDSDLTVDNTAVAYVYQDGVAGYWDCDIIYGRDLFGVTESNLGHALGRTADEMMMFINSLTPEAIAVALDEYGHDLHPRW